MSKLIGIVGFIGAGKDTAGEVFINNLGYKKDSFAASLKDTCSSVFGWNRTLLEGRTAESREWREQVDDFWSKELNIPNFTPRYALQYIGTNVFRKHFHEDIWLLSAKARMKNTSENIILTDCRFENEIKMIKDLDGTVIRIKRGEDPTWLGLAKDKKYDELEKIGIHASEYSWVPAIDYVDITIENNLTIEHLHSKIFNTFK